MIVAATDGSSLSNPGPAGWAWVIDEHRWACGGEETATNNQMELQALLDLLEQTAGSGEEIKVLADSQYVINTVTKWMSGWKAKGWKKKDGTGIANLDLIKSIDEAVSGREVSFEWVKGHDGHELNEQADTLARRVALSYQNKETFDPGPGFSLLDQKTVKNSAVAEQSGHTLLNCAVETDNQLKSSGQPKVASKPVEQQNRVLEKTDQVTQTKKESSENHGAHLSDKEVLGLVDELHLVLSKPDRSGADHILAKNFAEIDSVGAPHSRSRTLANLAAGKPVMRCPDHVELIGLDELAPYLWLVQTRLKWRTRSGVQTTIWVVEDEIKKCRFRQTTLVSS